MDVLPLDNDEARGGGTTPPVPAAAGRLSTLQSTFGMLEKAPRSARRAPSTYGGSAMRFLLLPLLLVCSLLCSTGLVHALDIEANNNSRSVVALAVHYLRPTGHWSTDGWYSIQPGKTFHLKIDSKNTVFYVHAVRVTDGKVYTLGDTIDRWVCDQPFSLTDNAQPAAGGRMALFSQYEAPNLKIAINFN